MEETEAPEPPHIAELRVRLTTFPTTPGVYIMRDAEGTVIYVGKAVSLRARVRSYLNGGDGRAQIEYLMLRVRTIETIGVETEQQAFILERDLIQKYKPRYNIRLKDDKSYLSIRINEDADWPRLEVVRRVEQDGARYFGPYTFSHELRTLLEIIKRVVPLRTCADTVFYNRTRPCLEYQIKRCAGPCCLEVDRLQYREWVKQAIALLEGKNSKLVDQLEGEMDRAAEELRFEDAAAIRDRIRVLEDTKDAQPFVSAVTESQDVFSYAREESLVAIAVLQVRWGRIVDSTVYSLEDVRISDAELMEAVVGQYYEGGRDVPGEIIVPVEFENQDLLEKVLRDRAAGHAQILAPKRGSRQRLLDLALLNAQQHFAATFNAEKRYQEIAREMAKAFRLRQVPRRIETVDISNFQASDTVGAVVSFYDGEPDKARYRTYKLERGGKPDDFASIAEVITRRLTRGKLEENLPDLMVIDGGPGQLGAACAARDALGIEIDIISIAKMRTESDFTDSEVRRSSERIFLELQPAPIALPGEHPVTHFMQRMRDEVHRFVITFHRKTRGKRVFRSVLDDILGVGPERRLRLFKEFGSIKRLAAASAEEVARAGRMPKPLAEKILTAVRQKQGRE